MPNEHSVIAYFEIWQTYLKDKNISQTLYQSQKICFSSLKQNLLESFFIYAYWLYHCINHK